MIKALSKQMDRPSQLLIPASPLQVKFKAQTVYSEIKTQHQANIAD